VPPELFEAHVAERFGLSPEELDRADARRLYLWYALLVQEETAYAVKQKMESAGGALSEAERAWREKWWDYIPAGSGGIEAIG